MDANINHLQTLVLDYAVFLFILGLMAMVAIFTNIVMAQLKKGFRISNNEPLPLAPFAPYAFAKPEPEEVVVKPKPPRHRNISGKFTGDFPILKKKKLYQYKYLTAKHNSKKYKLTADKRYRFHLSDSGKNKTIIFIADDRCFSYLPYKYISDYFYVKPK